jgi:hypothetical protein
MLDPSARGRQDSASLVDLETALGARRPKRRWKLRVVLLALLVAGEVALAHHTGTSPWPHGLRDVGPWARTLVSPLRSPGHLMPASKGSIVNAFSTPAAASAGAPQPVGATAGAAPVAASPRDATQAAAATATTAPPHPSIPADMGILDASAAPAGHRIFVDGHMIGQTPQSGLVKCGSHQVHIGGAGRPHTIDIPCGSAIRIGE